MRGLMPPLTRVMFPLPPLCLFQPQQGVPAPPAMCGAGQRKLARRSHIRSLKLSCNGKSLLPYFYANFSGHGCELHGTCIVITCILLKNRYLFAYFSC